MIGSYEIFRSQSTIDATGISSEDRKSKHSKALVAGPVVDIIAHHWSLFLKDHGHSLDNVMRDLLFAAESGQMRATVANLAKLLHQYDGDSLIQQVETHVERGNLLVPDDRALGPCYTVVWESLPKFELGFSRTNKIVTYVKENSAAYKAGLRVGQIGPDQIPYDKNVNKLLEFIVQDPAGDSIAIKFYPQGETETVLQYRKRDEMWDAKVCEGWFSH